MVTFCLLVAPIPYGLKKRLFTFLTESKIVAKVAYGLKISFMCVLHAPYSAELFTHYFHVLSFSVSWRFSSPTRSNECSASPPRQTSQSTARCPIYERTQESQPRNSSTFQTAGGPYHSGALSAALTDVIFNSAQRNVYLTGFCLFLSLVLTRTFYIILDLIHTQEEYAKLKKAVRCPCSLTSVCVGLNGRDVLLDGFFVS